MKRVNLCLIKIFLLYPFTGNFVIGFQNDVCVPRKHFSGDLIQLTCNLTTSDHNGVWLKDRKILLFAGRNAMRRDNLENVNITDDTFSVSVLLTDARYEGIYSCSINGSTVISYCLSMVGKFTIIHKRLLKSSVDAF